MLIFIISVFVLDQSKYMSECVVQFQKLVLDHLLFYHNVLPSQKLLFHPTCSSSQ